MLPCEAVGFCTTDPSPTLFALSGARMERPMSGVERAGAAYVEERAVAVRERFDAVVIGSGLGGLAAGALLSHAGAGFWFWFWNATHRPAVRRRPIIAVR